MMARYYIAIAAVIIAMLVLVEVASAHEWYTGRKDPVTDRGCCGGNDCAPVPIDADWVQPVAEGYRVTLTLEQARLFNKGAMLPIDEIVPWSRVMVIGTDTVPYTGVPAYFHICIYLSRLRCLFASPGV